jgi:signal peptidase I
MAEEKDMGVAGWLQTAAIGRKPHRTLIRLSVLVALAVLAYVILTFVFVPIRVNGPSMFPTYKNGQFNFINRLAYRNSDPRRGDVIGIYLLGDKLMFLKRVVGLPGELVHFSRGKFIVNGKPLPEPYLTYPSKDWHSPERQLGPQEYYVVGDNRSMPFEFHEKGAAQRSHIVGRALIPGHPHSGPEGEE